MANKRVTKWYYCGKHFKVAKVWYYSTPHFWFAKNSINFEVFNILITIW